MSTESIQLGCDDALLLIDLQNDFLPEGALAVPDGDAIVPVLNSYIERFTTKALPVFASRDWHPDSHCSFSAQGGTWPKHCVAGTAGAQFAIELELPDDTIIISKATQPDKDAYSAFEDTELHSLLQRQGLKRLFIGGLATDYCVVNTVMDALKLGYTVVLLADAIAAVNVHAGDGIKAEKKMLNAGARAITKNQLQ